MKPFSAGLVADGAARHEAAMQGASAQALRRRYAEAFAHAKGWRRVGLYLKMVLEVRSERVERARNFYLSERG